MTKTAGGARMKAMVVLAALSGGCEDENYCRKSHYDDGASDIYFVTTFTGTADNKTVTWSSVPKSYRA